MSREADFDAIEKGYYKVMVDGIEVSQRSKPLKAISDALAQKVNNEDADVYIMQPNIEVVASVKCETTIEPTEPQVLKAFPTAIGAGAYVTGGRGGEVLHVTNLNDSGEGSLRWALTQTFPRIIVFDVSGVINIDKLLYINSENGNFTIAGQSAPNGGITIDGGKVYFSNVPNIIVRYIAFRGGIDADLVPNSGDNRGSSSFSAVGGTVDQIFDHCSFSYGNDESGEWYSTRSGNEVNNVTVQKCFFAEGLKGSIFGKQSGTGDTGSLTFAQNLFYNTSYRFPNISGDNARFDLINNVIWNANGRLTRGDGNYKLNHIGNYYNYGEYPITDQNLNLHAEGTIPQIYTNGNNIIAKNTRDSLTNTVDEMNSENSLMWKYFVGDKYGYQLPFNHFVSEQHELNGEPFDLLSSDEAFENVINNVGTNLHEDKQWIEQIKLGNFNSKLDKSEYNVMPVTSELREQEYYINNPHIPEEWFSKNVPSGKDHNDTDEIGYTYIEKFLNQIDK